MGGETPISDQTCWMADDQILCSEENCLLPNFDPALCFEPGEQLTEEQIPEFEPLKQKDQFDNLAKPNLVENTSNDVEKQEVDESTSNHVQKIIKNITKKGKAMKTEKPKQKRKYTRKQKTQDSTMIASGQVTLGLTDKLIEAWNAHIEALREIKSLATGLKTYGIDIQLPEIMI